MEPWLCVVVRKAVVATSLWGTYAFAISSLFADNNSCKS